MNALQKLSPLEESFRANAKDVMAQSDVKGVLCTDERGQPFYHEGTLSESSAAILSQLVQISSGINSNPDSPTPIITLTSSNSKVVVARNASIIVAVHRTLPSPAKVDINEDAEDNESE